MSVVCVMKDLGVQEDGPIIGIYHYLRPKLPAKVKQTWVNLLSKNKTNNI